VSAEWGVSDANCSSTCGDGFQSLLEMCDDGNLDDGDGCSAGCEYEDAGMSGLWECQAREASKDSDGTAGLLEYNENATLPAVNVSALLQIYPSAEAAAAASPDMCRRDVCRLVAGISVAAAEQTAQVVTTGENYELGIRPHYAIVLLIFYLL